MRPTRGISGQTTEWCALHGAVAYFLNAETKRGTAYDEYHDIFLDNDRKG